MYIYTMRSIYFSILLVTIGGLWTSASAVKKSVLFIGNSYIYTNNVPEILEFICLANNDTLYRDQNTPGGYTLEAHSTNGITTSLINSQPWDIVILQEQSQRPAFPQSQVETEVYPYATDLYNKIKAHNSCTEVMFMMTWGYKNGDASNCAFYPPICTYSGMQDGIRTSYLRMALDNNANVAPVGAAWKVVRDSFPNIDLYSPDESHPSLSGSYLEACVLYASIFHKSPVGNTYTAGLNATDAGVLQSIAAMVTLDSLEQWQQYGNLPYARYLYSQAGNTISFQNLSQRATGYSWDFGDGNTSIAQDPVHTYARDSIYTVTLTAENGCNTEIYTLLINTYPDGVVAIRKENDAYVYWQNGYNYLKLNKQKFDKLCVYDMNGKEVFVRGLLNGDDNILLPVSPGIYVYKLYGAAIVTGKFSQQ